MGTWWWNWGDLDGVLKGKEFRGMMVRISLRVKNGWKVKVMMCRAC